MSERIYSIDDTPDVLDFFQGEFDDFTSGRKSPPNPMLEAVSLFSGGGVGDFGYHVAGFNFLVHAEVDPNRCKVIQLNYPESAVVEGKIEETWRGVVDTYKEASQKPPALLAASPPCQGMTPIKQRRERNPWKHGVIEDDKNNLYSFVPRVTRELRPRVVVVENVPGVMITGVRNRETGLVMTVAKALLEEMPDYYGVVARLQMAHYGVPQMRDRTFFIFVNKDEGWIDRLEGAQLLPVPAPTHGLNRSLPLRGLKGFLSEDKYPSLDSASPEKAIDPKDPLHAVPVHSSDRYEWIRRNPPFKGKSSYQSLKCEACEYDNSPKPTAICRKCNSPLPGVPTVVEDGVKRLIRGRMTAYRRMKPDNPAPTITTASGHFSSDNTIHPWENRVLSVRECVDLQTIPRTFRLYHGETPHLSNIREIIGEAIPPWFTFLLGGVLRRLMLGKPIKPSELLPAESSAVESVDSPRVSLVPGGPSIDPSRIPALNGLTGSPEEISDAV